MIDELIHTVQGILSRTLPNDDTALAELANRLETSTQILKVYQSGDLRVPLDRAFEIADVLELDRAQFFTSCLKQFLSDEAFALFLVEFGRVGARAQKAGE
jgi:hypothetical protein